MSDSVPKDETGRPLWYGRRYGHKLRPNRRRLMETLYPRLRVAVPADGAELDPAALFDRPMSEIWLEIGFGAGEHLAGLAARRPDVGFIGFEPFVNGVASLLSRVDEAGLDNVRVFDDDARLLLGRFPAASVARIFLLFADPWPKRRHWRRRFVQEETLDEFSRILVDGGRFVFASDHMGYVRWTLEKAHRHAAFRWLAERRRDWAEAPADWIQTRYEKKALSRGERPIYLAFARASRS